MKEILIVIPDMRIGGAQRSLLSFLQTLQASDRSNLYRISLMVIDPTGPFYDRIPGTVAVISPPKPLRWLGTAFSGRLIREYFSMDCLFGQMEWLIRSKLGLLPKSYNVQQKLWCVWEKRIPALPERYDIAIGYLDGCSNYYVMDKVHADKKVLWVHSEYRKQGYDPTFDRRFYEAADRIVTVSEKCGGCIAEVFPECEEKLCVLENITCAPYVQENAEQGDCPEFDICSGCKLLTVARLNPQKGVDLAVDAAHLLKQQGLEFLWLVAGDGPERDALQSRIDALGLSDCFQLLGSCSNPYAYMKKCDILVQPSRVEGRSIVLDEAKILSKPIVATNYTTVADTLTHAQTGWIVEMTPEALAEGILKLWREPQLRNALAEHLDALPKGNDRELEHYIQVMF